MLYVIHVMAGMETAAETLLQKYLNQDHYTEIFIPRYTSMRRYGGKWCDVLRALFPGYVFIDGTVPDGIFARMKLIPKEMQMIHADTEILSVYPEEEKFIKNLMDEEHIVRMSTGFFIGEELCITRGALRNYKGRIKKIDRHKRTAVLAVELFGRETPVEVGLEVVKKVSKEEFWNWKEEEQRNAGKKHRKRGAKKTENTTTAKEGMEIVLIKNGIFSGLEGEVLSGDEKKVEVSIHMLGQFMKVELGRDEIESLFVG